MYEGDALDALDITHFLTSETEAARQRHVQEYVSETELGTFCLSFDASRPPFDDPRVRRAFVLATDRDALAVARGFVFPATGGFVPPGMPGHLAGIALPYDPEGARELLGEAGYPGGRGFPVVEALAPEGPEAPEFAEFFLVQWRGNLDVEILWEGMGWATYLDRLNRSPPHMFAIGWTCDFPDPDNFLRVGLQRNTSGWRNEAYERLVEDARRAMDQEERMKLYGQAERILVEEAPIMLTAYMRRHRLVKPWVSRFPTSASRPWFWRDVIIEPH